MRIGIAQIDTVAGALDQTVERMVAQSQRAVDEGIDLLVFPLLVLVGIDAVPEGDRAGLMHDVASAVIDLGERLACPSIVPVPLDFGLDENSFDALMVDKGDVWPIRMSHHMREGLGSDADEQGVAEFTFGGMRFALAVSRSDLDALDDYDYDVDAVIYLSGYPYAQDDPSSVMGADVEYARFADDAMAIDAWLVGVAPVGCYGDEVFTGSSMVLTPTGEMAALAPAFEEALLTAEIGDTFEGGLDATFAPEPFDAPFHLWQAVTLGIRDFASKQGYTDVALCLDGTLNASVLAALASDAVGPLHVHALVGSSAGAAAASCRELARRLRVDTVNAPAPMRDYDARDLDELELSNLARTHNALVLSPLDKTALALGAWRGGISAAQLCPLGDVYRSDVLDMAHVRNTISPLFRKVSLSEADALSLIFPDGTVRVLTSEADITHVDEALLGYVEYDQSLATLVGNGTLDRELVDAVLRAERSAELSRRAAPPVLAMSTHVLDDARFPLGMHWHDTHFDEPLDGPDPISPHVDNAQEKDSGKRGEEHHTQGVDLDATLAMIRDIAEQGGFMPSELGGIAAEGSFPTDGSSFVEGEGLSSYGWSPFSEN